MTAPGTGKPLAGLIMYSRLLLVVSAVLVGGAYALLGIDFAGGVLLGCGIVGLNYLWSKRVFSRVLREDHPKARLGTTWVFKFGLTALILYIAIVRLGVDPVGIVVGVSAIVIAGLLLAAAKMAIR